MAHGTAHDGRSRSGLTVARWSDLDLMRHNGKAKRNVLPSGHPDSYYAATANATAAQPQLAGSVYADACVIGGGFTGRLRGAAPGRARL